MAATKGTNKRVIARLCMLLAAIVVILALALGLGLGLGLKHHHHSVSNASTSNSTTASTTNSTVNQKLAFVSRDSLVQASNFELSSSWNASAPPTTRVYNFTVEEVWGNPGGLWKPMIVVNRQSPGPTIEANLGDQLVVHVTNKMQNATAIHWHGQYQNGTNFFDGTTGITQCGIPPNATLTYNFTIQNVGTYWWHSHFSTQYTDGLFGAMVLHSPNETAAAVQAGQNSSSPTGSAAYDRDVVILMGDLYNTLSTELLWRYELIGTGMDGQPGDEPVADGGYINGISQSNCAYYPSTDTTQPERRRRQRSLDLDKRTPGTGNYGPVLPSNTTCQENVTVQYWSTSLPAKSRVRLRLVNSGSFASVEFSIDNHTLTVVEADGVSVEPVEVSSVVLAVAQRYSVIIELDQTPGAYWIRNEIQTDMFTYDNPILNTEVLGVLRYDETNATGLPANTDAPSSSLAGLNADFGGDLKPADILTVPNATRTGSVDVSLQYLADGRHLAFMNSTSWEPLGAGQNTLFDVAVDALSTPVKTYSDDTQLMFTNEGIHVFDLVVNNLDDGSHPFHLHGHTFWIMDAGAGEYTGISPDVSNPMRRDTVLIQAYGYAVLRFVTDNPGLWAFHCHISWHMATGLLMQFVSIPSTASMEALYDAVPQAMHDQCTMLSGSSNTGLRRRKEIDSKAYVPPLALGKWQ